MQTVYNASKVLYEEAKEATCPRCKGHGGLFSVDRGDSCCACLGEGIVLMSVKGTGWIRSIKEENSYLY